MMSDLLLLLAEIAIYFAVLASLFRLRHRLGIGAFICGLGAFHFFETYLAASFYVAVPLGIVVTPGSAVLFVGKLYMLLLLYVREDATAVRQPIYGLFIANLAIVALTVVLRNHAVVGTVPGRLPDLTFLADMGGLMVWGTTLLFVDCIMLVLLYERLAALRRRPFLRLFLAGAAVLSFDQVGFYLGLRVITDAPLSVLFGGWFAKLASACVFAALSALYLRLFERARPARPMRPIWDVFDVLTYRERYTELLAEAGRDSLTGLPDRRALERAGAEAVSAALRAGRPVSLLVLDIDFFKSVNDRLGHSAGDLVLREVANRLAACCPEGPRQCYRFGGEEFVMVCAGLDHAAALSLAEALRARIAGIDLTVGGRPLTASIGVATAEEDGASLKALFDCADARLYAAKHQGRDRVVGRGAGVGAAAAGSDGRARLTG